MRDEAETNRTIERYGDTVRRLCMIHLKNEADTQDIFQTVFLKYLLHDRPFESQEHEKAWFIRVTINACKDLLKSVFRSRTVPLEELSAQIAHLPDQRGAGGGAGAAPAGAAGRGRLWMSGSETPLRPFTPGKN